MGIVMTLYLAMLVGSVTSFLARVKLNVKLLSLRGAVTSMVREVLLTMTVIVVLLGSVGMDFRR